MCFCVLLGSLCQVGWSGACFKYSISKVVRKDMRDLELSQDGDKWSVKLDVQDLGGHHDTTFRGWSVTLAARVWLDISERCMALKLLSWLIVVCSSCVLLYCFAVWSRWQPLANSGAVLSLLDGLKRCGSAC